MPKIGIPTWKLALAPASLEILTSAYLCHLSKAFFGQIRTLINCSVCSCSTWKCILLKWVEFHLELERTIWYKSLKWYQYQSDLENRNPATNNRINFHLCNLFELMDQIWSCDGPPVKSGLMFLRSGLKTKTNFKEFLECIGYIRGEEGITKIWKSREKINFDDKNDNSGQKLKLSQLNFMHRKFDAYINIFYQKYTTRICLINLKFLKFLSWTLSSSSWFFLSLCMCMYMHLWIF